jgi:hypothetical protein
MGYILVLALREAGVKWWLIFSLSGHSALLIFLLVSLYLFALSRGVGKAQKIELEHPLTTTSYYMGFYGIAPFLGALAGSIGMVGSQTIVHFLLGIALGTLGTTFFVWVIVDPVIGFCESMLPESHKHRAERLAMAEVQRKEKQERRRQLLAEVLSKEESERIHWQQTLRPQAERLADLLETSGADSERAKREVVDIGAAAWQTGGLSCMQELRNMAIAISNERREKNVADYVSVWWDGIGNWRKPSLG